MKSLLKFAPTYLNAFEAFDGVGTIRGNNVHSESIGFVH